MLARLWNYRPTAAGYKGSDSKPGSLWDAFYAYKEKLILNKSGAFKADDVTTSYDSGFFMRDGRFQGHLNLKCRLFESPTQRNPCVLKILNGLRSYWSTFCDSKYEDMLLDSRVHFNAVGVKQKKNQQHGSGLIFISL